MEKREAVADQLAAVLREIAEMERREGFGGPKITHYLLLTAPRKRKEYLPGDHSRYIWEDHVVGAIVRAAKAHRNPENHLEDWMIDIEDGGDGQFVVYIKDRLGHKLGVGQGPLALAAATAYRDALKEMVTR